MSFDLNVTTIIRYAYNILASGLPAVYLYGGAAFGAFVLGKLLALVKS